MISPHNTTPILGLFLIRAALPLSEADVLLRIKRTKRGICPAIFLHITLLNRFPKLDTINTIHYTIAHKQRQVQKWQIALAIRSAVL